MNSLFDVKENDEHALDFALYLSHLSVILDFPCTAHASFPKCLSKHWQGLCCTFPEICTKFDAVPSLYPSQNHIGPNTRLQIKGDKNQHAYPVA
jgi:hypothetical protein